MIKSLGNKGPRGKAKETALSANNTELEPKIEKRFQLKENYCL